MIGFLRRVLPSNGLYIASRLVDGKFVNLVVHSIEEMAMRLAGYDAEGMAAYHACASYRDESVITVRTRPDGSSYEHEQQRVQKNVKFVRSFWADLDVDPANVDGRKYQSQDAAVDGLLSFCDTTSLPVPLVVNSGYGVHCYWTLDQQINTDEWKPLADAFKALAASTGLKADPACTGDSARVLRPVGTFNRKVPGVAMPVEVMLDAPDITLQCFRETVTAALAAQGVKAPAPKPLKETPKEQINAQFAIARDFPPCSAAKVAERCRQLGKVSSTRGNVDEPLWYAAIQLLVHATEGDALIHDWSAGYPGYSAAETDKKIAQSRGNGFGPTSCATFAGRNPGGCDGCPFLGKITSPAQLGTVIARAPAPSVQVATDSGTETIDLPNPPEPFIRGEQGGIYMEEQGITYKVYDYDCYPVSVARDNKRHCEVVRIRHHLPMEGWQECSIDTHLLAKPVDFEVELRKNHIAPLIRIRMTAYMEAYLAKIKQNIALRQIGHAQGWKNDDSEFVLGDKCYRPTGSISVGAEGESEGIKWLRPKGRLDAWSAATAIFEEPLLAQHAFFLLCSFAAPLMKFAGHNGITVCAVGDTNAGKSTMGRWASSVYGHPEKSWVPKRSTENARFEHMGLMNNLPVYIDEVSTMKPAEAVELVYLMTTGRGKGRLDRNAKIKEDAKWSTILMMTSNRAMYDKLQAENPDPEAESVRLLEFDLPTIPWLEPLLRDLNLLLESNYGLAGPRYIQYLVAHRDEVRARIEPLLRRVTEELGMLGKERFWTQAITLSLLGGEIAREMGLIQFDPWVIKPWLLKTLKRLRSDFSDTALTGAQIFAAYLNDTVRSRLVVSTANGVPVVIRPPTDGLAQRFDVATKEVISAKSHVLAWLRKNHFDPKKVRAYLLDKGILLGAEKRAKLDAHVNLGAGTVLASGSVPCWHARLDHEELGEVEA